MTYGAVTTMPANTTLAKHYDHLEPEERLVAVLSALARRDEPEATRLADSCPRATYTSGDPAFFDRLFLALDAAALAAVDLQGLCGRLDGLRWAIDAVRAVTPAQKIGAMATYLQGVRRGHERAGGPRKVVSSRAVEPVDDAGHDDDLEDAA